MLLQQFYLKCLAHASYVVADERSKQAVVARSIGRSQTFLSDVETGKRGLTVETLMALARALECDAWVLVSTPDTRAESTIHARARAEFEASRRRGTVAPDVWDVIEVATEMRWRQRGGRPRRITLDPEELLDEKSSGARFASSARTHRSPQRRA